MYNANKPNPDDLPSTRQLLRSTILAAIAALVILVTVVLPAEYGIDPTKIGRFLGLAEMGEIKVMLAEEAEADRRMKEQLQEQLHQMQEQDAGERQSSLLDALHRLIFSTAQAQEAWTDELRIPLAPNEGAEVKLVMQKGAIAEYAWIAEGGVANFDMHGDSADGSIAYEKGRAVPGDEGELKAADTGFHGWFWRNRGDDAITIVLKLRGAYSEVKRTY